MAKALNLEGKRFGRLTAIERCGTLPKCKKVLWKCRCDCGGEAIVTTSHLMSGHTQSCGCINVDRLKTHGCSNTKIFWVWTGMKSRCNNKLAPCYKYYGGRGITVCKEWESFENFYAWSMENGYVDGLTIDRIDVNGNYDPSNCRWATTEEQNRNKRDNVYLTYNGETRVAQDWAKEFGINRNTLDHRIKIGWSVEKALTTPIDERYSHKQSRKPKAQNVSLDTPLET